MTWSTVSYFKLFTSSQNKSCPLATFGGPVIGGEIVGVVGDEFERAPGDRMALADMGDREQFHVDDIDIVLVEPGIARR